MYDFVAEFGNVELKDSDFEVIEKGLRQPRLNIAMQRRGVRSDVSLANVRLAVSTAMRLPEIDAHGFREKFGIELAEAYGIIEVGLPFVNRSTDPSKQGSVGSILPVYQARIADPDADGVGEVYL